MKYSIRHHLLAGFGALVVGIILTPILLFMAGITFLASIPSQVGERVPIEGWIYRGMDRVLDLELMRQFRDDLFHRIRPHIEPADELERWWVIREMELARERTNRSLQSGEYAIVFLLALGDVFLDASLFAVPASLILTVLAIAFSGLVLLRIVATKIVAFDPALHIEEQTHDLTVRMAFNRGPFSKGSPIAIALLTLLVGVTRGHGYEFGLEIIEGYTASTHPGDVDRWQSEE